MFSTQLIKEIEINWDKINKESYLRGIPALCGADHLAFTHPVTFFVGENGSGKSTLLEAIAVACGFSPEGGTRNYSFSTYDSHSELHSAIRLLRGVRRPGWGYFLQLQTGRDLSFGRAGGGALTAAAADSPHGDRPVCKGEVAVHNRDSLADPAGVSRSADLKF